MILQDKSLQYFAPCFTEAWNVVYTDCCCGFLSRHIAAYPPQCRFPRLWELWREYFNLKSFVPQICIKGPVCCEKGSELFVLWTISQAVEYFHQHVISLLFWHSDPSPCMSSTIFNSAFPSIVFFCGNSPKPIVASFVSFILNHSKFKIWGDIYCKYVCNLTWWITMSEDLWGLPSKKFLPQSSFLFMRYKWHLF